MKQTIKVFTYNLRCDVDGDGINAFRRRHPYVKQRLEAHKPDIIGFQEILPHMRDWLCSNLDGYTVVGIGRDNDLQGESNVIAYRTNLFTLISLDTFWLSDTPAVPGSRFSTDQSSCPRICTCATLKHNKSDDMFRFYNTHLDHVGPMAQIQGLSEILQRISKDNGTAKMPYILTGDFNNTPDSALIKSALAYKSGEMKDSTEGTGGTYHGFGRIDNPGKIDYIFTDAPFDPSKSAVITDSQDGVFMSDHYPVVAFIDV
jgi:Metal-dependent hydrolase